MYNDLRVNVAATRCREGLVILGAFENLKGFGFFEDLTKVVSQSGILVPARVFSSEYVPEPPQQNISYLPTVASSGYQEAEESQ